MNRPVLYGADYSVYVRIARMALLEKQVEHDLVSVDVFAQAGLPAWFLELHPFGRIPVLSHGDFHLYETAAIVRYVDEAFDGPALQPGDAPARARLAQITGLLDAYAYRPMVWDVAVERTEKSAPDEALIEQGLTSADAVLTALARLKLDGDWLLGDTLSLADLHAAPIVGYFIKAPEGKALLSKHAPIDAWFARASARKSFRATETTG